jgi:MFS family permease
VLGLRDMRLFLASRFLSASAMTLLRATISWHVYSLSSSESLLGLIGAVQFAATFLFTLVGGAVADSYERRRIVITTQLGVLFGVALLFGATAGGVLTLPLVYAVLFLNSTAAAFENPARSAMFPALVPRAQFQSAVVLFSSLQNLAWVSGPVVSGFLLYAGGPAAAYALHLGLTAGAALLMAFVRPRPLEGQGRVTLLAVREGIRFVVARPALLGAMSLDMIAVIFASSTVLLPVVAQDVLRVDARGYGLLSAFFEVGTVSMSILLVLRPPIRRAGRALLGAVVVYGAATSVFGLSTWFPLSLAAYAVAGMADQVSMVARSMLVQLATPDALRGRVNAVNFVFIGASNELGSARAGFLAQAVGVQTAIVAGGLVAIGIAGVMSAANPALRRYKVDSATSE